MDPFLTVGWSLLVCRIIFLSIVLARFGIIDESLIEGDNIIVYVMAWVVAVPLAFKSTNTQFFFGAKKDR